MGPDTGQMWVSWQQAELAQKLRDLTYPLSSDHGRHIGKASWSLVRQPAGPRREELGGSHLRFVLAPCWRPSVSKRTCRL
jgi:hypothetical protein